MTGSDGTAVSEIRERLTAEAGLDGARFPIRLDLADGRLTLEGEVPTVAAKKLACAVAQGHPAVAALDDRLRVAQAQRMSDDVVRDELRMVFNQEPAFSQHRIVEEAADGAAVLQEVVAPVGEVRFAVVDGIVFLRGRVPSVEERSLAAVLAWWVAGTRDVVVEIAVDPPVEDSDARLAGSVRLALDKDPLVADRTLEVRTDEGVVTLRGKVPSDEDRTAAEADAWYVPGVIRVINEISVP
ncbi:MAG: BON domain-containing protein [Solirubrobacterales bacterium]